MLGLDRRPVVARLASRRCRRAAMTTMHQREERRGAPIPSSARTRRAVDEAARAAERPAGGGGAAGGRRWRGGGGSRRRCSARCRVAPAGSAVGGGCRLLGGLLLRPAPRARPGARRRALGAAALALGAAALALARGGVVAGEGIAVRPSRSAPRRRAAGSSRAGAPRRASPRRRRPRRGASRGHPGGQAFVVGLDRHLDELGELVAERARRLRLRTLVAVERDRQPDDDELGLVLARPGGDRGRLGRLDDVERARDRPARVGDRAARAGVP